MLDIRQIREDADAVNTALQRRNSNLSIEAVVAMDSRRREILAEEEQLRSQRNQLNKQIGDKRKAGENADDLQAQSKTMADTVKNLEAEREDLDLKQSEILMTLPNLPLAEVPQGQDETQNVEVKRWGDSFKSRPFAGVQSHWDIGPAMGLLDFERGVKVAQSRFSVLRGEASRLSRALINFMLDSHTANGYEEMIPPFLVNRDTMTGTGQLPKFEEDMFQCKDDPLFLIPTAEVPLTNLYRDEEIAEAQLPFKFTAHTPCFRREAGSAGRDTRGLIRQHQFDKVELVKLTTPDQAEAEHEAMVRDAEGILEALELPYRRMLLCTGDMGFSAAKCFDLEVWLPGVGEYREISSISNCTAFQARRANLKYRPSDGGKLTHLYTMNGSGLAVGRTLIAVLENYQISETEVAIPTVLQPYFRNGAQSIRVQ